MGEERETTLGGAPASAKVGRRRVLVTLLFTDVVESVALKQRLGDQAAISLIRGHHSIVRQTLALASDAREIETAGDSFLFYFTTTSEAVRHALLLHERLEEFNRKQGTSISDRIGIHMGEVDLVEDIAGRLSVHGIQVDTCARVMSLAEGGQILMTRPVFDNARQSLKGEEIPNCGVLNWFNHGWYRLKGIEDPVEICEARCAHQGPGKPPTNSEKGERAASAGELVLGWRPAVSQMVPNTQWVLEEALGEGGFGEVWLAWHRELREQRVFKFCFRADRVRSLKREVTLFRVLKHRVGEHANIVRLYDTCFDKPPFYLEEEYVNGRDLKRWAEKEGGLKEVPLEARLEIVVQAATALQAAHDAGIIHRDVKPGNILITGLWTGVDGPAKLQVKLTDFGIAQVVSVEALAGITRTDSTEKQLAEDASRTGTQLYMAPELVAGNPASIRSDIYALGVVLYQLVVGDFHRPMTTDWAADIEDPLLREDLKRCLTGNANDRFAGAGQLAERLRSLPERRRELREQQLLMEARERAAYRRGILRTAGIAALVIALIGVLGWQARSNNLAKIRQAAQIRSSAVRLTVANGLNPAENGDWLTAALWFSEAFALDESFGVAKDPDLTRQSHVLRINSVLRQSPQLEQMWFDMTGISGGFALTNTHLLLGTINGYRLYNIHSGEPASPFIGEGHTMVNLAPDARRAVTGGGSTNAMIILWNVHAGVRIAYMREPGGDEPFRGDCSDLQFSPDGRWIAAVVSAPGEILADRVLIWDAETGGIRRVIRYADIPSLGWTEGSFIITARFDPSSKRLVTTGTDKRAVVWHWQTDEVPVVLQGHSSWVYSAAFGRAHTNWLITCSFDRTACIWDLQSGRRLQRVEHEGDAIRDVQFSPDDRAFVTGGLDFAVRVWGSETGRLIPPILRSHDRVASVGWSADGARVLTRTLDGTVRLWRFKGETPMVVPSANDFSEDGRYELTHEHGTVRVRSTAKSGDAGAQVLADTNVFAIGFAGGTNRFLCFSGCARSDSSQIELRQLGGKAPIGVPLAYDPSWTHMVCAPGGKRVVFYGGHDRSLPGEGGQCVTVWEPESSPEPRKIVFTNEYVETVAFDHEGRRMAVATVVTNPGPGMLRLIDLDAQKDQVVLHSSQQRFAHLVFSKDDQRLVASQWSDDLNAGMAAVLLADKGASHYVHEKDLPDLDGVLYAAISDSGDAIATASEYQTATVWHRSKDTWEPSLRPLRCGGQVYLCVFSRNGRWLATAHRTPESQQTGKWSSHVRIWDIANNEARSLPFAFPGKLTRLGFVAGDTRLFVERWSLPEAPHRWIIDLAEEAGSAKELLLRTQLLSAQRSFLSGRVQHLPQALESKLSAEDALVHASGVGPLRPLSKEDCRDLWRYFSSNNGAAR